MPRTRKPLRVACLRAVPAVGDLEANWRTFERFARRPELYGPLARRSKPPRKR